jgi:hypothetical protein
MAAGSCKITGDLFCSPSLLVNVSDPNDCSAFRAACCTRVALAS